MGRPREGKGGARRAFSYANVMATIAVFVALGGGVYAASQLPRNSVGSKQIKRHAVGRSEIKKDAVGSSQVKDGSLMGSDIAESTLAQVPSAKAAASGQPTSFAHVSAGGVLDSAFSKNVGSVTVSSSPSGSTYCISGIPFSPRGGQATVDFADSLYTFAQLSIGGTVGCPGATQAVVFTESTSSQNGVPAGFYVVLYG